MPMPLFSLFIILITSLVILLVGKAEHAWAAVAV